MRLAYIGSGNIPFIVEDQDFDFFVNIYNNIDNIIIVNTEDNTKVTKKKGSKSYSNKDVWVTDPSEIERAIKYEKYPIVDMRFIGLFSRNPNLYADCIIKKTKNINEYIIQEDKINILVNVLLKKSMNIGEIFTMIQYPPSDEQVRIYMERLSYLILEEQKMNGEIGDINATKQKALELSELKDISIEDIELRCSYYQDYMRYLLTKDDYINITEQDLNLATTIKKIVREKAMDFESRSGISLIGYSEMNVNPIIYNESIRINKICSGFSQDREKIRINLVKYVDQVIENPSKFAAKNEEIDLEISLLLSGLDLSICRSICVLIIDKNFSSFIIMYGNIPEFQKKTGEKFNKQIENFVATYYKRSRLEVVNV